jgi:hypothetical protein
VQAASKAAKVALVGMGAAALVFGKQSVTAYAEAETAQSKLTEAYRKFPAMANVSIGSIRELNSALALKTRFDDDATASGQAVLAGFKLTGSQVRELTPLLQDYAARTGKDLPTAARDLGKAVLGQGKALKGVGLNFKDTGDRGKNLDQIMRGLRTQVGGFATSEGRTAAGQAEILKNQFGELQEDVGAQLIPALSKTMTVLMGVSAWAQNNQGKALALAGAVVGLTAAVAAVNVATKVYTAATTASAAATAAWGWAMGTATTQGKLAAAATKVWAAGQWILNAALTANPIGLIIVGVAALIGALVLAYKKSDTFRRIVDAAFKGVAKAASVAFGWIKGNWPKLLAIVTGPIGIATLLIVKNWTRIKAGAQFMAEAVKQSFLKMALAVGKTIEKVLDVASKVPGIGSKFRSARDAVRSSNTAMQRSIDQSKSKVESLKASMSGIKSKSVTVTVNTQIRNQSGWHDPKNHGVTAPKATGSGVSASSLGISLPGGDAMSAGMAGGTVVNVYIPAQVVVGTSREFRDLVVTALREAGLRGAIA